ncbi:putative transcription termination/antitermination protein [Pseudoalteromonas virus vB_PspP-H6/1]|nr:putative transcription termination/antitermination protein [Pseudoalteromonas virus vB_PspP-H6/1]
MNDLEKLFEHAPEGAAEVIQSGIWLTWRNKDSLVWDVIKCEWSENQDEWKTIATRPQPNPKPQPKFKVGDTVKRINGAHCGMCAEDCATVTYFNGHDEVGLKEYGGVHSAEMLELAKQPEQPRKTVEDAVSAFPDGFPKELSFPGEQGWWFNSNRELVWVDQRGLGRKQTTVCNQSEFEACVDAKDKSEPEWTHVDGDGDECKIMCVIGNCAWISYKGTFSDVVVEESSLKTIKPTMSKAEAWDKMQSLVPKHGVNSSYHMVKRDFEITD